MQKPDKGVIKRLLSYLKPFRFRLILVIFCILISALAGVMSALFLQNLIDNYITPLMLMANPDFGGLLSVVLSMATGPTVGQKVPLVVWPTCVSPA